jgi:hypothetical protein
VFVRVVSQGQAGADGLGEERLHGAGASTEEGEEDGRAEALTEREQLRDKAERAAGVVRRAVYSNGRGRERELVERTAGRVGAEERWRRGRAGAGRRLYVCRLLVRGREGCGCLCSMRGLHEPHGLADALVGRDERETGAGDGLDGGEEQHDEGLPGERLLRLWGRGSLLHGMSEGICDTAASKPTTVAADGARPSWSRTILWMNHGCVTLGTTLRRTIMSTISRTIVRSVSGAQSSAGRHTRRMWSTAQRTYSSLTVPSAPTAMCACRWWNSCARGAPPPPPYAVPHAAAAAR